MTQLEYFIPETLDEALELLESGIPLAGGSALTPKRSDLRAVIDLRNLGLDEISNDGELVEIGAATKLQTIVETEAELPRVLRDACKLEAGWNIRNMATLGGTIMNSDGRSALLTTLLALNVQVELAPGPQSNPLHEILLTRHERKLITSVKFSVPGNLKYEQVARSPADWPLVCAAVGFTREPKDETIIVLGGFGDYPIRLMEAEKLWAEGQDLEETANAARDAYKNAEDKWASGEYRSEVAGVLVKRLLKGVQS
jgi:putative selenate reductase FAD-binding subunit